MPDGFVVRSHKGPYSVTFFDRLPHNYTSMLGGEPHFLVDSNVARLHAKRLRSLLEHPRLLVLDATEANKSIARVIPVVERLVANGVRRDHTLVAVGGGIVQDITCFIASTLMRGVPWKFVPTTLLAQADSCIGSKSSINLGAVKNILGTFNPPGEVLICTEFLDTLEEKDLRSGIGEILKVHAIEGAAAFDRLAADYDRLLTDRVTLLGYIRSALLIKQRYIEIDEFDRGARNIFNYGHSFGHAIESATDFRIPHGIAVTMGMDIANRIAVLYGKLPEVHFQRMHPALRKNYGEYANTSVPGDATMSALMRDKKNTTSGLVLILPTGDQARIERIELAPDEAFHARCIQVLGELRT